MAQVSVSATILALILAGGVVSAGERPDPEIGFAESWILVRLEQPIAQRAADGSYSLQTGLPGVDRLIADRGVRRIEPALPVSLGRGRDPERLARFGLDRTYRFETPAGIDIPELVADFSDLPGVEYAEPDYVGQGGSTVPNDASFDLQWGLSQASDSDVDGPEAWDLAVGDPVVIAVLDTGADSGHEDLAGKLVPGYDFANVDTNPEDDHGHGTNVSSIAAAVTNNGVGVAGTCWNCRVMPLKVLDENNYGFYSWWADAMIYGTDAGARIFNLSIGGTPTSATLQAAAQYAWDAGVINVSITHNDNTGTIRYPGRYAETLAIGGTNTLDDRAVPFCYHPDSGSNYGPEIDVVAPGNWIYGAAMGGGYNYWCGTSQAAPLVAGLVGLMRSINPSLGREEARHLLRAAAEDMVGDAKEDEAGFDPYYGHGRVNMNLTLQATLSSISLRVEDAGLTRLYFDSANPVASSYDFIRGELGLLWESGAGVGLGGVVCLEDDSPDADTAGGNEDTAIPAPGTGFFYLGRFSVDPTPPSAGAGEYGGSSLNRDRAPAAGDCAGS